MKTKYKRCMLMMLSLATASVVLHAATLQGRTQHFAGASVQLEY